MVFQTTRRRYLAAVAGATASLAGCSNVTSQSFEASMVALPESARESLQLLETARDTRTIEPQAPTDDVEVSITNRIAVYNRSEYLKRGESDA